ncbi:MAG: RNA polymerase sigma factor [Steroidobacteraceae bacterium]
MTNSSPEAVRKRLADWYGQWVRPLRRHLVLRSRLSSADVDDVAQEVFLRLLRYERAELVTHPQAYLFKIAGNVLAEWSTRANWQRPHASEWLTQLRDESDPEHECAREAEQAVIRRAVGALPPRTREILRMHYDEGLTHEAIARQLGVTRRIVKRDLIRAYAGLRGSLDGVSLSVTQATPRGEEQ